jgi:hypothetical protein
MTKRSTKVSEEFGGTSGKTRRTEEADEGILIGEVML